MATVDKDQPVEAGRPEGGGPGWVLWVTTFAAVVGVLLAGGALLRDYFGWERTSLDPGNSAPTGVSGTPGAGAASAPTSGPPTAGPSVTGPATVHVDSLPVKAGAKNIVPLPRPLKGQAGLERAITVRCPENAAQDKGREVTYELRRRYQDLTLGIQASSPDDPPAPVRVTVYVAVKQPDDSVDRLTRGSADARQGAPNTLTADVAGADDLILRVECESPTAVVVLADARLTPA